MEEKATVTITLEEYFDLRSRAEANLFLIKELGSLENRLFEFDKRLYEIEARMMKG